jgi:general secretion pathway protein H
VIRERRSSDGFTLIEVMIVIALVALVTVVSAVGLRSFAKTDLRNTASRMAGAIRYLFDRASTTGKVHRLVLDFEEGRYWAEVTEDTFIMAAGKETEASRRKLAQRIAKEEEEKRRAEEQEATFGGQIPTKYLPKPFVPKRAKFNAMGEMAIRPVTLKSSVLLGDIYTPRLDEPLATGRGYLYFFPLGMTEAATIHLSDKKQETFYTLLVHPLNGRVTIKNAYVEANLTKQVDDAGEVVLP